MISSHLLLWALIVEQVPLCLRGYMSLSCFFFVKLVSFNLLFSEQCFWTFVGFCVVFLFDHAISIVYSTCSVWLHILYLRFTKLFGVFVNIARSDAEKKVHTLYSAGFTKREHILHQWLVPLKYIVLVRTFVELKCFNRILLILTYTRSIISFDCARLE